MTGRGDVEARWRAARRDAVRRHHPDRGGDPAAMRQALDEVDRRLGCGAQLPVVVRRTLRTRVRRVVVRRLRRRRYRRHVDL